MSLRRRLIFKLMRGTEMSVDERLARYPINDCEFSVRTRNALQRIGRFRTLADLDQVTDDDLHRWPGLGPRCIREIRETIKAVRFSTLTLEEDMINWVVQHKTLVRALMNGEAVIMPLSVLLNEHLEVSA